MRDTEQIVGSLAPGLREALSVKDDGTIIDGNTRIKVLDERRYDVDSLPQERYRR